jgi:hypothetical protein
VCGGGRGADAAVCAVEGARNDGGPKAEEGDELLADAAGRFSLVAWG